MMYLRIKTISLPVDRKKAYYNPKYIKLINLQC